MTGLWKTWMTLWCWGIILFGVGFTLAAFPATGGFTEFFYGIISNFKSGPDVLGDNDMRFTNSLIGAITIGWGLTIIGLVKSADTVGAPAWRALTLATSVWYVVDGIVSIATGYPLNALSNTFLYATYLIPVLASGVLSDTQARTA